VGHEGLEPSANGLRDASEGREASSSGVFRGDLEGATRPEATPKSATVQPLVQDPAIGTERDAVEAALADALTKAATAGRFDVVAQLARELAARREAGAGRHAGGGVVDLDVARRKRGDA
jgi:hypothetical protein